MPHHSKFIRLLEQQDKTQRETQTRLLAASSCLPLSLPNPCSHRDDPGDAVQDGLKPRVDGVDAERQAAGGNEEGEMKSGCAAPPRRKRGMFRLLSTRNIQQVSVTKLNIERLARVFRRSLAKFRCTLDFFIDGLAPTCVIFATLWPTALTVNLIWPQHGIYRRVGDGFTRRQAQSTNQPGEERPVWCIPFVAGNHGGKPSCGFCLFSVVF